MAAAVFAIEAEGLNQTYGIPELRVNTLKSVPLHPFRRSRYTEFHVLQDASFRILNGEFLGILGRNGSGNSTLLKCLAGIRVDSGRIWSTGRLRPVHRTRRGLQPGLTAVENVEINDVMIGLTRPRRGLA
jgi:ABC-2 type transport system ATP-binding protein